VLGNVCEPLDSCGAGVRGRWLLATEWDGPAWLPATEVSRLGGGSAPGDATKQMGNSVIDNVRMGSRAII
jgi:hypothetical protein